MNGHGTVKTRKRYQAAINHYNFLLLRSANAIIIPTTLLLWNCFKKILQRSYVVVVPACTNKTDITNTFCKFFYDKVLKIRSTLQSSTPSSITGPNSTKKFSVLFVDIFITPITNIVNYSITEGSFPSCIKIAYVTLFKISRALRETSPKLQTGVKPYLYIKTHRESCGKAAK